MAISTFSCENRRNERAVKTCKGMQITSGNHDYDQMRNKTWTDSKPILFGCKRKFLSVANNNYLYVSTKQSNSNHHKKTGRLISNNKLPQNVSGIHFPTLLLHQ